MLIIIFLSIKSVSTAFSCQKTSLSFIGTTISKFTVDVNGGNAILLTVKEMRHMRNLPSRMQIRAVECPKGAKLGYLFRRYAIFALWQFQKRSL